MSQKVQDQENSLDVNMYRRSSLCSSGTCVEVAIRDDGTVNIRDNKDLTKDPLTFTADEWVAFIGGVKSGEFNL